MIELVNVTKVYKRGAKPALNDVSIAIDKGEFVFLVGPSGSGKSTLLSLILREERATSGKVMVLGRDVTRMSRWKVPQLRRQIGTVFQDFRLLESKSVFDNVALALQVTGYSRKRIRELVPAALEVVGLEGKEKRMPHELSGGEQQRVAIARALAMEPQIMLFDEPTSALDPELTGEVLKTIQRLAEEKLTMILVTHEMAFARSVADQILFMVDGVVEEEGTPEQIFTAPRSERTQAFLASMIGNR